MHEHKLQQELNQTIQTNRNIRNKQINASKENKVKRGPYNDSRFNGFRPSPLQGGSRRCFPLHPRHRENGRPDKWPWDDESSGTAVFSIRSANNPGETRMLKVQGIGGGASAPSKHSRLARQMRAITHILWKNVWCSTGTSCPVRMATALLMQRSLAAAGSTNCHQPIANHQLSAPVPGDVVNMWGYPVL